ncbi:MAG: hypothetical protein MHM6MM_005741 [Cercozoa sp. M6MM]
MATRTSLISWKYLSCASKRDDKVSFEGLEVSKVSSSKSACSSFIARELTDEFGRDIAEDALFLLADHEMLRLRELAGRSSSDLVPICYRSLSEIEALVVQKSTMPGKRLKKQMESM